MSERSAGADEFASYLEQAANAILTEVLVMPPEVIMWKPASDVWSVMEILCHVDEFIPYWTGQTLQIVRRPGDEWGRNHTDPARLNAVRQAESRSILEVVGTIRSHTAASAAAIRQLKDSDLLTEAMSRNPRWEHKPASFVLIDLLIEHLEKHLGQIRRNVSQFHDRQTV